MHDVFKWSLLHDDRSRAIFLKVVCVRHTKTVDIVKLNILITMYRLLLHFPSCISMETVTVH